jgi:hypothetical protein
VARVPFSVFLYVYVSAAVHDNVPSLFSCLFFRRLCWQATEQEAL